MGSWNLEASIKYAQFWTWTVSFPHSACSISILFHSIPPSWLVPVWRIFPGWDGKREQQNNKMCILVYSNESEMMQWELEPEPFTRNNPIWVLVERTEEWFLWKGGKKGSGVGKGNSNSKSDSLASPKIQTHRFHFPHSKIQSNKIVLYEQILLYKYEFMFPIINNIRERGMSNIKMWNLVES